MTTRAGFFGVLLLSLANSNLACSKREPPPVDRVAILPFELLSGEGGTDRAGPALLSSALATVPNIAPMPVDSVEQGYAHRANRFLHSYVVSRGGKLELRSDLEDAASHKILRNLSVEGEAPAGMGPLTVKLAKEIRAAAKPVDSPAPEAYKLLNRAFEATEPAEQDEAFAAAIQTDPRFGEAYVAWAKALLARGDRERAAEIAEKGESAGLDEFTKANLAFIRARAEQTRGTDDGRAEISALKKLIALSPAAGNQYERLAELEFAGRQFAESSAAYREALRLDPANGALDNMRGYAEAFAGNLEQARQALKNYEVAAPEQRANALDSLGEVDFSAGDFAGAEAAFLSAQEKDPAGGEWRKAAQARLMTGDLAGADRIFARFAKEPAVYQRVQWEFVTGRRKSALANVQAEAAKSKGDRAALLWAQAAVWQLQTGDRVGAAGSARNILLEQVTPVRNSLAGLTQFLLFGGSVGGSVGGSHSSGSPFVDALASIFQQNFQTALPPLEQAYARTVPSADGQVRLLLAWANVETGHFDRAKELLRIVPIPMSSGDAMFTSLIFPRFFALRSAILAREGKQAEAQRDRQLFQQYSGDLPDKFH